MTAAQKAQHRDLYNQLRLAIVFPGESVAGVTKLYEPVNKDNWTWEDAMAAPDTPNIARMRARGDKSLLFRLGRYEQVVTHA